LDGLSASSSWFFQNCAIPYLIIISIPRNRIRVEPTNRCRIWKPLPSLTQEGPWCGMQSRPDISWSSASCRVQWASPWTVTWQRHPTTQRAPCRRQRTYRDLRNWDRRKARRLRRPASRLRGLTTDHPNP
jgi:hypothetical protein